MAFLEESDYLESNNQSLPNPPFSQREGMKSNWASFSSNEGRELGLVSSLADKRGILKSHAATNYQNRYPKVYGKRLGILTDVDNTPVQEVITGTLDVSVSLTGSYIAHLTDSTNLS
jgi:hypothetical protein